MTPASFISALQLPPAATVDRRVPKKLLLENGVPTAADKRLINEGVEDIHWLAALKPAQLGVPEYRDEAREYVEIAVVQLTLRPGSRTARLVELVHRAIPHPILLITLSEKIEVSAVHKRHALNEAGKVVLDGSLVTADLEDSGLDTAFLQALPVGLQPRGSLLALYQAWLDAVTALQAARHTGEYRLPDSAGQAEQRRRALADIVELQDRIAQLQSAAIRASQMARQVELNIELQQAREALASARSRL